MERWTKRAFKHRSRPHTLRMSTRTRRFHSIIKQRLQMRATNTSIVVDVFVMSPLQGSMVCRRRRMQAAAQEHDRAAQRESEDALRGKLSAARVEMSCLEQEIAELTCDEVRACCRADGDGTCEGLSAWSRLVEFILIKPQS